MYNKSFRLITKFLQGGKGGNLRLLPEAELNQAVFHEFVQKDNKGAIANHVEAALKRTQARLEAAVAHIAD